MTTLKTVLAGLLAAFCFAAGAQQPKPEEKKAEKPKPAAVTPKKDPLEPILEIKRTGPPDCPVKPVLTDEEIEICKRAGRAE